MTTHKAKNTHPQQGEDIDALHQQRDARKTPPCEGQLGTMGQAEEYVRYQAYLLQSVSDAIIATDTQLRIRSWNKGAEKIYGWKEEEVLGKIIDQVLLTEFLHESQEEAQHNLLAQQSWQGEVRQQRKNGESLYAMASVALLKDATGTFSGGVTVNRDITDRKLAEEQLQTALKDKDLLLREILHRTKNNMAAIISLLHLQSARTEEPSMITMFQDIEHRIHAMLLVQQKLYQSHDITHLELSDYLRDLAEMIFTNLRVKGNVTLRFHLTPVVVSPDTAIPCGLLLNELLTNALKYAFPHEQAGEIFISVQHTDVENIEVGVRDTGIGIPESINVEQLDSLGINLVMSFIRQLQGTMQLKREAGTTWFIRFPHKRSAHRIRTVG